MYKKNIALMERICSKVVCRPCVYVSLAHAKTDMLYCLSAKKVVMTAATKSNPSRTTKERRKTTHKTLTMKYYVTHKCQPICTIPKRTRPHSLPLCFSESVRERERGSVKPKTQRLQVNAKAHALHCTLCSEHNRAN